MRVSADNHVNTEIAKLLRNCGLIRVRRKGIFVAPMHVDGQHIGAVLFHFGKLTFDILVKCGQIIIIEGVDKRCGFGVNDNAVERLASCLRRIGFVGIADKAEID